MLHPQELRCELTWSSASPTKTDEKCAETIAGKSTGFLSDMDFLNNSLTAVVEAELVANAIFMFAFKYGSLGRVFGGGHINICRSRKIRCRPTEYSDTKRETCKSSDMACVFKERDRIRAKRGIANFTAMPNIKPTNSSSLSQRLRRINQVFLIHAGSIFPFFEPAEIIAAAREGTLSPLLANCFAAYADLLADPTLSKLECLHATILIAWVENGSGRYGNFFTYGRQAVSLALELNLVSEECISREPSETSKNQLRKTFWSVIWLEIAACTVNGKQCQLLMSECSTSMPSPEISFCGPLSRFAMYRALKGVFILMICLIETSNAERPDIPSTTRDTGIRRLQRTIMTLRYGLPSSLKINRLGCLCALSFFVLENATTIEPDRDPPTRHSLDPVVDVFTLLQEENSKIATGLSSLFVPISIARGALLLASSDLQGVSIGVSMSIDQIKQTNMHYLGKSADLLTNLSMFWANMLHVGIATEPVALCGIHPKARETPYVFRSNSLVHRVPRTVRDAPTKSNMADAYLHDLRLSRSLSLFMGDDGWQYPSVFYREMGFAHEPQLEYATRRSIIWNATVQNRAEKRDFHSTLSGSLRQLGQPGHLSNSPITEESTTHSYGNVECPSEHASIVNRLLQAASQDVDLLQLPTSMTALGQNDRSSGDLSLSTPLWSQTPLIHSTHLSTLLDCDVYLKLENLQPSQSFKYRGISLYAQHCKRVHGENAHLIIASGGNAGLAAACAAKHLDLRCTVYIPEGVNQRVHYVLEKEKAEVIVAGNSYLQSLQEAERAAKLDMHATLVPAYDDPLVWKGHSSMIAEITTQLPSKPDAIFCSVGGGGLLGGIIDGCSKAGWDDVTIVALETHGSACFYHSISLNSGQWKRDGSPSGGITESFDEPHNIKIAHVKNLTSKASSLGATSPSAGVVDMALRRRGSITCATIPDEMAMYTTRLFAEDHKIIVELACATTLTPAYHPSFFNHLLESQGRRIDMSVNRRKTVVFIVCGGVKISLEELMEYKVVVNDALKESQEWEIFCDGERWHIPILLMKCKELKSFDLNLPVKSIRTYCNLSKDMKSIFRFSQLPPPIDHPASEAVANNGLRPKFIVPPVPHPTPYHRLAILATEDGLLLRPIIPGGSSPSSCVRIPWGCNFGVEELSTDTGSEDYDWDGAAVVFGVLGCLNLNSAAYVLVITAKSDVGYFLDKRNEVYAIKSVSVVPLQRNRASSVISTISVKFNQANMFTEPLATCSSEPCDLETSYIDASSELASQTQTRSEKVTFSETNGVRILSPRPESDFRPSSPTPSTASTASSGSSAPTSGSDEMAAVAKALTSRLSFWSRLSRRQSGNPEEEDLLPDTAENRSGSSGEEPSEILQGLLDATSPVPVTAEEQQNELDDKILKECVKEFTKGGMYFAYNFDITTSLQQKQHEVARLRRKGASRSGKRASDSSQCTDEHTIDILAEPSPTLPLWRRVTKQFWWNENLLQPFIDVGLHSYVLPVMQGFYQITSFHLPREPDASEAGNTTTIVAYIVVSRRSRDRAGLRYQRRGVDDDANVANFVETEAVTHREGSQNIFSYIQIRGSIPLFWTQSGYSLKPPPMLSPERTHQQTLGALRRHFTKTIPRYGPHIIVNLAEQLGKEAAITNAYREYINELGSKDVRYTEYDFHSETKGMKYENIAKLIRRMDKTFDAQGFTWVSGGALMSEQKAIFRVNCIDCLDRTNVVQSAFARHVLDRQLGAVALQNTAGVGRSEIDKVFNDVWANNGDAISRAYAGTSALKGDYTRTGKRDLNGMLNDGMNSLARMYASTFSDWFSQAVIDFMLGYRTLSVFSEFLLKLQSTDPRERIRIDNIRAEAIAESVSRVLSEGERLLSGWTLLSPAELSTRVNYKLEEKVVLLSVRALYIVSYDYTLEKVTRFSKVPLNQIISITKGAYILSTLEEGSRDRIQNYGFMVHYHTSGETTRVTSYSLRNSTDGISNSQSLVQTSSEHPGVPKRGSNVLSRVLMNTAAERSNAVSYAAFKALPVDPARARRMTGSFEETANDLSAAKTCKEAVESIVSSIHQAVKDAGGARDDFVAENDIVSLEDAQRATSVIAKMEYGLKRLLCRSYVEGYTPSQADVHVFKALGSEPSESPNVARWYKHIASYSAEHASLAGTSTAGEVFTKGAEVAKPTEDDDDEIDLFGSDEEEDAEAERIKAERVKAYQEKKANKPKTIAKSVVTLEVKPWDDETDMAALEAAVRSIEKPGLVWGAAKLVAIGFGIKKLQITLVIEDELVSVDELQEEIAEFEDFVQSSDVAAMQIFIIDPSAHIYEPTAALEPQGDASHTQVRPVDRVSREQPLSTAASATPYTSTPSSNYTLARALSHTSFASSSTSSTNAFGSGTPILLTSPRIRSRTEFELEEERPADTISAPVPGLSLRPPTRTEDQHARKRLRLDDIISAHNIPQNLPHYQTSSSSDRTSAMRLVENSDNDGASTLSVSFGSESSLAQSDTCASSVMDGAPVHSITQARNGGTYSALNGNGLNTDGITSSISNGLKETVAVGRDTLDSSYAVQRVNLPGTRLSEDSYIDREEFVRLVIQSLRDVGYMESAATLESESGYKMESPEVTHFRKCVLEGRWVDADSCLSTLGVSNGENLREARFLISQQKYLELLEVQSVNAALHVLRNELAPLNIDVDELHSLSSLIMCSNADDLKHRAKWDGAKGASRKTLLSSLQRFIPPSTMMPLQRMPTLIEQALSHQRTNCFYHNAPYTPDTFSLYTDHQCNREAFPLLTTNILKEHMDEVWNIKWSHDGQYLASASKDKTAFIWRIGPEIEPNVRECALEKRLRDHQFTVGCLAWSPDDSIILTSTESIIKVWNAKTGRCIREMSSHEETVSALEWLPDGLGFLSGGMDRKIIIWDAEGAREDVWVKTGVRVTDLAVAPDLSRVVVVGLENLPIANPKPSSASQDGQNNIGVSSQQTVMANTKENRLIIYDFATRTQEASICLDGELTSVKISQDSRYALVNHAPDLLSSRTCVMQEVQLWDLENARMARKFTGQRQGHHVIRSCFGGVDGNFIVSGSEDSNVAQAVFRFVDGASRGNAASSILSHFDRSAHRPLGLVKQAYSAYVVLSPGSNPRKWHLTAYFTYADLQNLPSVDSDPTLRSVTVPPGVYRSGKARSRNSDSSMDTSSQMQGTSIGSSTSSSPPAASRSTGASPSTLRMPQDPNSEVLESLHVLPPLHTAVDGVANFPALPSPQREARWSEDQRMIQMLNSRHAGACT
ncbi:hypothetical protein EW145_g1054 [Phellinidium pouzarii]|uniref:SAC domain-containing protein n=1 Tax=Phellinidium pouzarii TaxID=167371 RepID=A0A4S4LFY1_9AGAM|nr:hypothetical protein EW145_g1054 [Phellinidium pouzarii]